MSVKNVSIVKKSDETTAKILKRQKSLSNFYQNDEKSVLKIVHLNDFCLQEICHNVDLIDLINLADANVRLAIPAKAIFSQIYGKHRLNLTFFEDIIVISMRNVFNICNEHNRSGYPIFKHKDFEKMLNHFGEFITKIKLVFEDETSLKYNVFQTIANYCSETLLELEISDRMIISDVNKPFKRLEKLTISNIIDLSNNFCQCIPKQFPNLHDLGFRNVSNITTHFALEQQFPHLEHFSIYTWFDEFNESYLHLIRSIVRLNPQLKSLGMFRCNSEDTFVNRTTILMPHIEKIDISPEFAWNNPPFQFDNLTSMSLMNTFYMSKQLKPAFPQSLQRLELHFICIDQDTVDLLQQCHYITALMVTLSTWNKYSLNHFKQIAEHLPKLKEIEFRTDCEKYTMRIFCFSAILTFIEKCDYLTDAHIAYWIEKDECENQRGKWIFNKSKIFLARYSEELNQLLTLNRQQWSMRHEVRFIDLMKGWLYDTCFCVALRNINPRRA